MWIEMGMDKNKLPVLDVQFIWKRTQRNLEKEFYKSDTFFSSLEMWNQLVDSINFQVEK